MKLYGTFVSPYVRRVGVSLNVLGLDYEHLPVAASKDPETVRRVNPLTRVPAFVLGDGEALIESWAILDALDELVGPERALLPAGGAERRQVLKTVAVGLGAADKSVWSYYEVTRRPEEKIHQPWLAHNEAQVMAGYAFLEETLQRVGRDALFHSNGRLNQAGITVAVAFRFTRHVRPNLDIAATAPTLATFSDDCEATDAFRRAALA